MNERIAPFTHRHGGSALLAAGFLAFASASLAAQFVSMGSTPDPKGVVSPVPSATFDVASIKPQSPSPDGRMMTMVKFPTNGHFTGAGLTVKGLVCIAYGLSDFQVAGGPSWIDSDRFDVEAKPDPALEEQLSKMTKDQATVVEHQMMQALLADRFKLALHHETKELPTYALVVAKGGPKFKETKPDDASPDTANSSAHPSPKGSFRMSFDSNAFVITANGMTLDALVNQLGFQMHSTVQNQTGLKGNYDFTLRFTPEDARTGIPDPGGSAGASDNAGISVFAAVEDQLGLKLESKKSPVDVVVVDHLEKPSEN